MNTEQAFQIFVNALTASRHLSDGSTRVDVGPITFRHWQRHKDGVTTSHDEALAQGCAPHDLLNALQARRPEKQHYITVLDDAPDLRASYEQSGYVCTETEFLMVLDLTRRPVEAPSHRVETATPGDIDRLNASDPEPRTWVWPQTIAHPGMRHYFILHYDRVAARAFSWRCDAATSYVSHLFTDPTLRRRGLGKSLMLRLLGDCAARGDRWSVLVSSEDGYPLYRSLGYSALGRIFIFEPAQGHPLPLRSSTH
jgi:ribosomal protein S18 acetylase RimI-like enzyme